MESKQKNVCTYIIKICLIVAFVMYLAYLSYLTFFSHIYGRTYMHRSINLIPFKTILFYLDSSLRRRDVLTNIVGNIVAFVPMGFFLPIIVKRLRGWKRAVFIVLVSTIMVETIQYIAAVGASDIDDLILNVIGGLIGYNFSWIIIRAFSV